MVDSFLHALYIGAIGLNMLYGLFDVTIVFLSVSIGVGILLLKKTKRVLSFAPHVSIIIPAYNEEENIGRCLASILESEYDLSKLEILCIDDASTDKTRDIMKRYQKQYQGCIKVISGEHKGKAIALHAGVRQAKHSIMLFLDADMAIKKDYIKRITLPLQDKAISYVIGVTLIAPQNALIEYYQYLEHCYINLIRGSITTIAGYPQWYSGQAVCMRKRAFTDIGILDNRLVVEDADFAIRMCRAGKKAAFVKNAIAYTQPMRSMRKLFNQRTRWYFGSVQTIVKHRQGFSTKIPFLPYMLMWHLASFVITFVFVPSFLVLFLVHLFTEPLLGVAYIFNIGTILGRLLIFYYSLTGVVEWKEFILPNFLLGLLLFSKFFFARDNVWNWRLLYVFFTYPAYLVLLQVYVISSFVRFGFKNERGFVKE